MLKRSRLFGGDRRRLISLIVMSTISVLFVSMLTACNGSDIKNNSLGYDFIGQTLPSAKPRTVIIPPSQAKNVAHLRMYGIGVPPEGFVTQYGPALSPSQSPTQIWFKATLDSFPAGSVMIVGFDRSSLDNAPRANEISYVAGDNHPTTDTQAETIAVSLLPDDTTGPTNVNQYNGNTDICQSETYTSATLAKLFPPQDFLDDHGNLTKAGTVTLSLFPHYQRYNNNGKSYEDNHDTGSGDQVPDQSDNISSFLLVLGTKAYC